MNFRSTEYQWLVVAGAKAKFKGDGTINGEGDYGFMLSAIDGDLKDDDIDRFRIKIWEKATDDEDDVVVYDNQMGDEDDADADTAIGGGSIVIHEDKKPKAAPAQTPDDSALLACFPNPANPDVWIPYRLASESGVVIRIYDVSGHLVRTLDMGSQPAGFYASKSKAAHWDGSNEAGERVASGIYFYSIQASGYTATRKLIISK